MGNHEYGDRHYHTEYKFSFLFLRRFRLIVMHKIEEKDSKPQNYIDYYEKPWRFGDFFWSKTASDKDD